MLKAGKMIKCITARESMLKPAKVRPNLKKYGKKMKSVGNYEKVCQNLE